MLNDTKIKSLKPKDKRYKAFFDDDRSNMEEYNKAKM